MSSLGIQESCCPFGFWHCGRLIPVQCSISEQTGGTCARTAAQTSARRTHSGSPAGAATSALSPLAGGKRKEKELDTAAGCANDAPFYSYTTFWQYADSGPYPGDQDLFNGDATGLSKYVDSFVPAVAQHIFTPNLRRICAQDGPRKLNSTSIFECMCRTSN